MAFVLLGAIAAPAMGLSRGQESPCYDCHSEENLIHRSDDSPFPWTFSWKHYAAGLHKDLDCVDCHASSTPDGFENVPHKINLDATSNCSDCHGGKIAEIQSQFEHSVHASAGGGRFRCSYCHDPHAPPSLDIILPV
jgi:hypothetical protein